MLYKDGLIDVTCIHVIEQRFDGFIFVYAGVAVGVDDFHRIPLLWATNIQYA